jgi:hypothetical protein
MEASEAADGGVGFADLPAEVRMRVMSFCDWRTLGSLGCTCSELNEMVGSDLYVYGVQEMDAPGSPFQPIALLRRYITWCAPHTGISTLNTTPASC